jgi:hypothetical protein
MISQTHRKNLFIENLKKGRYITDPIKRERNTNFNYQQATSKVNATNATYWVPTQEKHYVYQTNNWALNDSTRNYYHTNPGPLAGKLNYDMNYQITSTQIYRDTISYNGLGYETKSRYIEWGVPTYTVLYEYNTSYYPSWNIKGYLSKSNQLDYNNCLPGGPVNKLLYSSLDTFIYNGSNHLIVYLSKSYNLTPCAWNNQTLDSFIRNSSNLVIRENLYNANPPSFTWTPNQRLYFTYNSSDTLTEVLILNYNSMTSTFDTSGKYKNIKFHFYNKYDLNSSVFKKYEFYNYSAGNFTPSISEEVSYDNFNNLSKIINKSWNGSSFSDTIFALTRTIYYKTGTTIGEIDSIVEKIKLFPNMPFMLTDKYIYKGIQVTGINDLVKNKEAFRLYPNPSSDYLNISSQEGYEIIEVNIYDLQGKLIKNIYKKFSDRIISINVSDLLPGYYGVQIKTKDGTKYQSKFIKN